MQKIYTLLRDNKQSGPYTLDEMVQLKPRPFDLVWVEGKSAGWSYPSEIDSLKSFVTETVKADNDPVPTRQTSTENGGVPSKVKAETKPQTAIAQPPKHIYISLPAGSSLADTKSSLEAVVEVTENESPEAKLERKAQELRNKIQAFAEKKNQPKAGDELDTKYSRSLEDIKEEYSSWLYQQRKKKNVFSKKQLMMAGSFSILLLAGYFLLPLLFASKKDTPHVLSAEEIAAAKPALISDNSKSTSGTLNKKPVNNSQKKKSKTSNRTANSNTPAVKRKTEKLENDGIDSYIDSLKMIEKNESAADADVAYEPSRNENNSRQSTKRSDGPASGKTTVKKDNAVSFAELVKLSESTGSGTPHLSLYNNSNRLIKFVAVDVSYYRANRKLLKKKTLYFNDIPPGSSAKLFVPREKNATSVQYQMGLISTDAGIYYAKQ